GILAFAGFAANPLLLSTLGLEPMLYVTLFVLCLYCFACARWTWLPVALGLLTLARADGGLLFVILLFCLPLPWRARSRFAFIYFAVLVPWHVSSWVQLGSFVPDTLILKAHQGAWSAASFASGLYVYYMERFPAETISSFVLLPFAVLAWGVASR